MDSFEKALKKYGSRSPPKSTRKPSRSNAQHVYLDPITLLETEKTSTSLLFDSKLEATCYRFLSQHFTIDIQQKLTFWDSLSWKPDFYLKEINAYVEVKGQWILRDDARSNRDLFVWQYITAINHGYSLYLCSDSSFQIGLIEVLDYVSLSKHLVGLKQ